MCETCVCMYVARACCFAVVLVFVYFFVCIFLCVLVCCLCACIYVGQSLHACASRPGCPSVWECMYVCLPHSCICTFQIMTAHLGVFAHASRQTIRLHSHTHPPKRTYSAQTRVIGSSCSAPSLFPFQPAAAAASAN